MTQRYLQSLNASDAMNAYQRFSPLDNLVKESAISPTAKILIRSITGKT